MSNFIFLNISFEILGSKLDHVVILKYRSRLFSYFFPTSSYLGTSKEYVKNKLFLILMLTFAFQRPPVILTLYTSPVIMRLPLLKMKRNLKNQKQLKLRNMLHQKLQRKQLRLTPMIDL